MYFLVIFIIIIYGFFFILFGFVIFIAISLNVFFGPQLPGLQALNGEPGVDMNFNAGRRQDRQHRRARRVALDQAQQNVVPQPQAVPEHPPAIIAPPFIPADPTTVLIRDAIAERGNQSHLLAEAEEAKNMPDALASTSELSFILPTPAILSSETKSESETVYAPINTSGENAHQASASDEWLLSRVFLLILLKFLQALLL